MASNRYPALQGYANITRLLALLVAGVVAMLGIAGALASMKASPIAAMFGAAVALALAWLVYVAIGASGDFAQLLIDLEQHARRVADGSSRGEASASAASIPRTIP